jgi:hypothetical protein
MVDPPQYKSGDSMTPGFIVQALACFRNGVLLEADTVLNVIAGATAALIEVPLALTEINLRGEELITVCGDIHGSFSSQSTLKSAN